MTSNIIGRRITVHDWREEGEEIARWFMLPDQDTARLDYRPSEPKRIQLKVGVLPEYLPSLELLAKRTAVYGRIRQCDIAEARAVPPVMGGTDE